MVPEVNVATQAPALDTQFIDELPLPYAEIDAEGRVVRVNRAVLEASSPEAGDPAGQLAWVMMPPSDWEEAAAAYHRHMITGEEPDTIRYSFFTRTGDFHCFDTYRRLIHDEQGRPIGMRSLSVDVTESTRALEEARNEQQWCQGVLAALPDAVLVIDTLGMICYANPAAEKLSGWSSEELQGRVLESMPMLKVHSISVGGFGFQVGLEGEVRFEATIADRHGKAINVETRSAPLVDKVTGITSGLVITIRPVLERASS